MGYDCGIQKFKPSDPACAASLSPPKENFGVFGAALPGTFYRRNESLPAEMRYFDGKPPEMQRFGSAWPQGDFTWVTKTTEIAPGFHLILLKGSWGVDLDVMELSLAIDTPEGIVLVVGCSHPTIEKVVEAAKATIDKPLHLVVGGLHLLPAKDEEINRIAAALHDTWKVEWIAPVHCTGEPAFAILKQMAQSDDSPEKILAHNEHEPYWWLARRAY